MTHASLQIRGRCVDTDGYAEAEAEAETLFLGNNAKQRGGFPIYGPSGGSRWRGLPCIQAGFYLFICLFSKKNADFILLSM